MLGNKLKKTIRFHNRHKYWDYNAKNEICPIKDCGVFWNFVNNHEKHKIGLRFWAKNARGIRSTLMCAMNKKRIWSWLGTHIYDASRSRWPCDYELLSRLRLPLSNYFFDSNTKWNLIYMYAIVYNLLEYLECITLYITFSIEKLLQKLRRTNFIQFISFSILF